MLRIFALFLPPTILLALRESELDAGHLIHQLENHAAHGEERLDELPKEVHDQLDVKERSLKAKYTLIRIAEYFGDSHSDDAKKAIDIFKGGDETLDDEEVKLLHEALMLMDHKVQTNDATSSMEDADVTRFMEVIEYFAEPGAEGEIPPPLDAGVSAAEGEEHLATAGGETDLEEGEIEDEDPLLTAPVTAEDGLTEGARDLSGNDPLFEQPDLAGEREEELEDRLPAAESAGDLSGNDPLFEQPDLSQDSAQKQVPPALLSVSQQDALPACLTPAMSSGRFESMTQTVSFFSDHKGKLQQTGGDKLVLALKLFDTNGETECHKHFADGELKAANEIIKYFAGVDKKIDQMPGDREYENMEQAVKMYPALSDLTTTLELFDTDKNQYLDATELNGFVDVSNLFATTVTTDEASEETAEQKRTINVEEMQRVISVFIGHMKTRTPTGRLDKPTMARLQERLHQFDIDGNKQLDASEILSFNKAITYFAGDDVKLKDAVERFATNGKTLDVQSTERLLEALGLFDMDGDEKFSELEVSAFFKVIKHPTFLDAAQKTDFDKMKSAIGAFFGAETKVDAALADQFNTVSTGFREDVGFTKMQEAVDIFDGADNTIDAAEATRLIKAMQVANPSASVRVKDTPILRDDLGPFMTIINAFAGDSPNKNMDETRFSAMQDILKDMKPVKRAAYMAPDHARLGHLVTMLDRFDVDSTHALSPNEICSLVVVVKSCMKQASSMLGKVGMSPITYSQSTMESTVPSKVTSPENMKGIVQAARRHVKDKKDHEICSVPSNEVETAPVEAAGAGAADPLAEDEELE